MEASRGSLEGRVIAGYQLERRIGQGEMSVVYRAKDPRLDRTVALKLFAREYSHDALFRQRLVHDRRVVAGIDHPHILPVFEVGEAEDVLYTVMKYVPGPDLRTLLHEAGPLPIPTALSIATQVASALDAAHGHGLVHRNIQPSNILIGTGPTETPEHVYLTGFGLPKRSLSRTGFTTTGQFIGTLDYLAPEVIKGHSVGGRSDLYSLACVVYETLSGAPPFERDEEAAVLWAHLYDTPPPLSERRPEITRAADGVLAAALAKAPEKRYASCLHFTADLRHAERRAGGTPPPTGPPSAPLSGKRVASTSPGPPFDDDDDEW
ncbi:serine/threonine-protein kinase [Streptomyces sp. NPDC127069]|uniref:serine/threonine-protein kinase n=1 Tax=Streptomyces sp. NPDC127069 TaxID=3347128 RepID=UPI003659167D